MLRVIPGTKPVLYLGEGRLLIYEGNNNAFVLKLADRVREKGMEKAIQALNRLFSKLTDLGLSFSLRNIGVEQDPEVEGWRYVLAEVEFNLSPGRFLVVEDFLIKYTYSGLSPKEATKLLLVFHNV